MTALIENRVQEHIVIVDGMGTAKYLAPAFISLGYPCLHVENKIEHHPALSLSLTPQLYEATFDYQGDIDELVEQLARYHLKAIVPGGETGVQLAVELARKLQIPFEKELHPASVWRDKYMLYCTLQQFTGELFYKVYDSYEAVEEDSDALTSRFPLVVKPRTGALAVGVSLCSHPKQLMPAVRKAFELNDPFHRQDDPSVIVMSQLIGNEFMINTVSAGGIHQVREIWHVRKKNINGVPAYYTGDFISPTSLLFSEVAETVIEALNKLGVLNGPCHIEAIKPKDMPAIIIDFGYRLQGMLDPSYPYAIYRSSTLLDATACIIDEQKIHELPIINQHRHARTVTIHAPYAGKITRDIEWSLFETIPQLHAIRKGVKKGSEIQFTQDGMTSFGTLYLVGDSAEEITQATKKIHLIEEQTEFYACISGDNIK